jgi:hypothetical protein
MSKTTGWVSAAGTDRYREAAGWYEERQPGLGERFTREVIAGHCALLPNPLIHLFSRATAHALISSVTRLFRISGLRNRLELA